MINGRLIGLGVFLVVILVLAFINSARADEYYNCQFLKLCTEGKPNVYIPAVECGRKCGK